MFRIFLNINSISYSFRSIANQNGVRYSDSTSYFKKYSSSKCRQTVCLHYGFDFPFKTGVFALETCAKSEELTQIIQIRGQPLFMGGGGGGGSVTKKTFLLIQPLKSQMFLPNPKHQIKINTQPWPEKLYKWMPVSLGDDNSVLLPNTWVVLFFICPTFYSLKILVTQPFSLLKLQIVCIFSGMIFSFLIDMKDWPANGGKVWRKTFELLLFTQNMHAMKFLNMWDEVNRWSSTLKCDVGHF
jgi:hypothetical protein